MVKLLLRIAFTLLIQMAQHAHMAERCSMHIEAIHKFRARQPRKRLQSCVTSSAEMVEGTDQSGRAAASVDRRKRPSGSQTCALTATFAIASDLRDRRKRPPGSQECNDKRPSGSCIQKNNVTIHRFPKI